MLLQTTYLPVEEVGRASGLLSPGTFRRVFLKHTGEKPTDYRQRYRLRTQRPRWAGPAATSSADAPRQAERLRGPGPNRP